MYSHQFPTEQPLDLEDAAFRISPGAQQSMANYQTPAVLPVPAMAIFPAPTSCPMPIMGCSWVARNAERRTAKYFK